jgi:hypothetical protein
MLAIANASPGVASLPSSPSVTYPQNASGASPVIGAMMCYNCSDLVAVSSPEASGGLSQPSSQFSPYNSALLVEDAWVWRGRVKSRWESMGFDSSMFELFMRMRGAKTRLNLLGALFIPKDRMQLAKELGLDWKAVDYQIVRLSRHGLVRTDYAFGRVKLYRLTTMGEALLRLVGESDKNIVLVQKGASEST